VRVKQPRLSALVWDVTEFVPGEVFTWRSSILGVTCVGTHRVSARAADRATITLALEQTGVLAPVVRLLMSRISRRYVNMEAAGLKTRCEGLTSKR